MYKQITITEYLEYLDKKEKEKEDIQSRLQRLFIKAKQQCNDVNIPFHKDVKIFLNKRYKTTFGKCIYNRKTKKYQIEINSKIFILNDFEIIQTIIHELIHTCANCMNHGHIFKQYCNRINTKYNYDCKTYVSDEIWEKYKKLIA